MLDYLLWFLGCCVDAQYGGRSLFRIVMIVEQGCCEALGCFGRGEIAMIEENKKKEKERKRSKTRAAKFWRIKKRQEDRTELKWAERE